jgi:hypothetical protein
MSALADRIAQTLTGILARDPVAAAEFLTTRFEADPDMLTHPGLVFMSYAGGRLPLLSVLGLLNGLLADTGEYVILEKDPQGQAYGRVVVQEAEPELFAAVTQIPSGRLGAFLKDVAVTHGRLACVRRYVTGPDGEVQAEQTFDRLEEADPLVAETRALAQAHPDQLAFGFAVTNPAGEAQYYAELLPQPAPAPTAPAPPAD